MIFIENDEDGNKFNKTIKIREMTHRKLNALKGKGTTMQALVDKILIAWIEDKLKLVKKGEK